MATLFSFILAFIVSLLAGNAAAYALAIYLRSTEEFIAVLVVLVLAALVSIVVFAVVYLLARHPRVFNHVAWGLAVLVTVLAALAELSDPIFGRSPVLELLLPSWIVILIQWGWVRRRWGRTGPPGAREMAMTRWPWIVTAVALVVVLNPGGLAVIEAALRQSVTDWFRSFWLGVTLGGAALVLVLAWVEYTIRGRRIERAIR